MLLDFGIRKERSDHFSSGCDDGCQSNRASILKSRIRHRQPITTPVNRTSLELQRVKCKVLNTRRYSGNLQLRTVQNVTKLALSTPSACFHLPSRPRRRVHATAKPHASPSSTLPTPPPDSERASCHYPMSKAPKQKKAQLHYQPYQSTSSVRNQVVPPSLFVPFEDAPTRVCASARPRASSSLTLSLFVYVYIVRLF